MLVTIRHRVRFHLKSGHTLTYKQTESFKKLPKTVANPPIPKFSDVDGKTGNGDPFYSLSHPSTS